MTTNPPRVTVHMVSSLDGYIAKPDGNVSWLETSDSYENGEDAPENVEEFVKTIGCFVMGSHTYEHAVELSRDFGWPYGDVPTIVLTRRSLPSVRKSIEFYSGDLPTFVNDWLKPHYKSIWVVGGAALVKDFIQRGLVDDIRQTIAPIVLGGGLPFFDRIGLEQRLHLKEVTARKNGMVELWYEVRKP